MEELFKALADPARRQIIDLLAKTPLNVNQLHEYFPDMTRQGISSHLNLLESSGLLKIYKAGKERYGYLNKQAFYTLNDWVQQYLHLEKSTLTNDYAVFLAPTDYEKGQPLSYPVMLQAMLSKDAAFDSAFYIAVKTTGIFCKPSCHAKPKPENVLFYRSKEEALKNGYRACKVCKP